MTTTDSGPEPAVERTPIEVLADLMAEVRARDAFQRHTSRAVDRATADHAAAYQRLNVALIAQRHLVAALSDGAGYDKGSTPSVEYAVAAALEVLADSSDG